MVTFAQPTRSFQNSHKRLIRIMVSFVILSVVFTCGMLVRSVSVGTPAYAAGNESIVSSVVKTEPAKLKTVEVEKGDTLWSIAQAYAPKNADVRTYVDKLMKANGLAKSTLKVGDILVLP